MKELLSIEELGFLKTLANRTWQEIAPDLVEIVGSPASRDSVFEVVVERLLDFAGSPEERELVEKLLSLSKKEIQPLKEELFPSEWYE